MTPCPKCGATYCVQRSIELQQNVRNLCRCESARACGYQKRGKRPCGLVRQALLDPDNVVELYACEMHAAQDCLDDPATAPVKEKAAKPKETKTEKYSPPMSVTAYAAKIEPLKYEIICIACKHRHVFSGRVVKMEVIDKKPLFFTQCPGCGVGPYADTKGPPFEMTWVSAKDFDNPPKPYKAPEPAPKKKKRK